MLWGVLALGASGSLLVAASGEETYVVLPAPLPPLDMPPLWPYGEILDPVTTGAEVDAELDTTG